MAGLGQGRGIDLSDDELSRLFPGLAEFAHAITSPESARYNCIAWVAHNDRVWWWPDPMELAFWPAGVPRQETLEAFRLAFKSVGFVECAGADIEPGVEKIAIYTTAEGRPTHAARQLSDGSWTSKLGRLHDVTHELMALTGSIYGTPTVFMSRLSRPEEAT